jgi:alpha-tubulin suppressor-like RCC1 family protein
MIMLIASGCVQPAIYPSSAAAPSPTVSDENNDNTATPSSTPSPASTPTSSAITTPSPTHNLPTASPSVEATIPPRISASDIIAIVGGSTSNYIVYLTNKDGCWWSYGSGLTEQHPPIETVVDAAVGPNHILCLTQSGTIYASGYNQYGQTGVEGPEIQQTPVTVPGLDDVQAVTAGVDFSMALRADGSVWGWGLNDEGQLGYATPGYRAQPAQVPGISKLTADIVTISSGGAHTLALLNDGTVFAWGDNGGGQIGDGTTNDKLEPVQVEGIRNIVAIAAGTNHNLALKDDGTVWSWGYNNMGQIGVQTEDQVVAVPLQIPNLPNIVAVSAGRQTSFALSEDGILWVWGENDFGQLGIGSTETSFTPVKVSGLTDVTAVVAGWQLTLARQSDGSLWGWGDQLLLSGVDEDSIQTQPTRITIEVSP